MSLSKDTMLLGGTAMCVACALNLWCKSSTSASAQRRRFGSVPQANTNGVVYITDTYGNRTQTWSGPAPTILAGSFNPLHKGHIGLGKAAASLTGGPLLFELAIKNADKGALSEDELAKRVAQFRGVSGVAVTTNTLYVDKAHAFPGAFFVLGNDTTVRLLDPKYYPGGDVAGMLAEVDKHDCTFICAGRHNDAGEFEEFDNTDVPPQYRHMFRTLPAASFCMKISSTAIRAQNAHL